MFEEARPFMLALAIGLLIGIERERAKGDAPYHAPLGSRTFTLLALLGAVAAHVQDSAISLVLALFAGAVILAGYFRARLAEDASGIGLTTEVAAMATFTLGYLAHREMRLAIMLAVITLALLALKPRIHEFAKIGLQAKEMTAALTFLVIAFVVLPLLPDRYVDPWGLVNPARLWLVLVLITGISFAGYIAVRLIGSRWGLPVAGFFAGFVSSTAATLSMARRNRETEGITWPLAIGIVLANVASAASKLIVVAVIFPAMLNAVTPVLLAPALIGALCSLGVMAVVSRREDPGVFTLENPVALRASTWFAMVLAVVLVLTSLASRWLDVTGVLATSVLGGTTSVNAVTFAVSTLAAGGSLPVRDAVLAILLAFLTNMLVKLGMIGWVGGHRLLLVVAPPMLAMMFAGVLAYIFG